MNCQTKSQPSVSNVPMPRHLGAVLLVLSLGFSSSEVAARAQEPVQAEKPPAAAQTATGAIRVFLDCNYSCDESYIKQEITFVDYMRDRRDADVHILLTTQETGGGGTEYTIKFIGLARFNGIEQTLKHVSTATAT